MRLATLSASDQPDALVLAILGDFGAEDLATMVRRLVEKLCALTGPDEKRLREYLAMLEILADNRHLALNLQEPYTPAAHQPRTVAQLSEGSGTRNGTRRTSQGSGGSRSAPGDEFSPGADSCHHSIAPGRDSQEVGSGDLARAQPHSTPRSLSQLRRFARIRATSSEKLILQYP